MALLNELARTGARLLAVIALAVAVVVGAASPARAAPAGAGVLLDRVAARFTSPETGGITRPRFIFERELAFEARLEALQDSGFRPAPEAPYLDRHVRAALERHMAEVLLGSLEITPEPTEAELEARSATAQISLVQQVGGPAALDAARDAERISPGELRDLLARRARASLYLDRMVAPMLTPSDTELRIVHRTTRTPFSARPYEDVAPALRHWYIAQRLNVAVRAFYEGTRSRIRVTLTQR